MARIEDARERFERATNRLWNDKKAFADFLEFSGRFYKLPSARTMAIFEENPNAQMVAEYETWKNFGRQVKVGSESIAVLTESGTAHYFDISQTVGKNIPYQWKLDKSTAQKLTEMLSQTENRDFKTVSSCVDYLSAQITNKNVSAYADSLNIPVDKQKQFASSLCSMVKHVTAARCSYRSNFKYNGAELDLSALDMLHSKAEMTKLLECVQITAKSALLTIEKSMNEILERGIKNERNEKHGELARNQGNERQNVLLGQGNSDLPRNVGNGSDGRGAGADERTDRSLRESVENVYAGELSAGHSLTSRNASMGADTSANRTRSASDEGEHQGEILGNNTAPDNDISGNSEVGERAESNNRTADNGGFGFGSQNVKENNENNETAEEKSSAIFVEDEKGATYSTEKYIQPNKELEIPADVDKFYINRENETVTWIYYNPDSSAGGQFVYTYMDFDDLCNAADKEDPLEYLTENCKQTTLDKDAEGFDDVAEEFLRDSEDISSREENYVDRENYNRVYRGKLKENETLEDIYERFNLNHPQDFTGHSLSVGDIVAVKKNGAITAHFVDSVGFTDIPDFTLSREERKARRTLTDNLTLIAENQLASDEMDDLGEKLFEYKNSPNYSSLPDTWRMGAGLHADDFESLTARYNNGEDIRAEIAQKIYDNMSHISFYEYPPADGIYSVDISTEKTDSGMTFRTNGGFEITYSWETLGEALITAARKEYNRHEQLDREERLYENNKAKGIDNQNKTAEVIKSENTEKAVYALKDYARYSILYYNSEIREAFLNSTHSDFDNKVRTAVAETVKQLSSGEITSELAEKEDFHALFEEMYDNSEFSEKLYNEISEMLYNGHKEIDKARQAAHEDGLPFDEYPYDSEESFDPYAYNPNRMSDENYERMHELIDEERAEARKLIGQNVQLESRDYIVEDIVADNSDGFKFLAKLRAADNNAENEEIYENWEIVSETLDNTAKQQSVEVDLTPKTEPTAKVNFTITDEHLGEIGAKAKFEANTAAIQTLKKIEAENRLATPEEQEILSRYTGWGGISQAFNPNNEQWKTEYKTLRDLLTDEEYRAASSSTLNAHYTSPTVINAIYKALDGFGINGGNILEPAVGVGNFFGTMPEKLRENCNLYGVELDSLTGRIARQLYQKADIQVKGFEDTDFPDNFFDAAVGNVPFGSYSVADKRYDRENFFIHDYFFAKTLDKVAPGGIVAFVTTKGTLDKQNPKVREYLAKKADLIGAIRLPNNAFKANAGTEVTTDIIFLQKREKMAVEMPDWCYVGNNSEGISVNSYFLDHPEMILGTMKQGAEFSLYGNEKDTACVPFENANLAEQLDKAVLKLKRNLTAVRREEKQNEERGEIPATADVRNFTYTEIGGKIYFRENNVMKEAVQGKQNPQALKGKALERVRGLIAIRNLFCDLVEAQAQQCSDEKLTELQAALTQRYDKFVKDFGYINDSANSAAFSDDDYYNTLCALEIVNPETKEITKSDIFTRRTIKPDIEITRVDTSQEAMQVSIDLNGRVDIPYMAQLCGKTDEAVISELSESGLIYKNPDTECYEEAAEYLSGNVRMKLRTAQTAAENDPEYTRNIAALEKVIPRDLEAGEITAHIGAHWVDVEDYQKFLTEHAKARFIAPLRRTTTGEYKIEKKSWDCSAAATQIFGTSRMNSLEIFENLLNCRDVVIRDKRTDPDGTERYYINKKETDLAQEKARQLKEAFPKWLWSDAERREKYVKRYNELFNSIVGREYDGSHQTFPGMSPFIELNPHQKNAVMRAKLGGNTLLAHCVGAGKSFEMTAAVMEKKRLGLINKACVVVPKHLVGQMANEWLRLYPQAKILTATEKDFDKAHRQKFIGRCCTGDYDAVIMSYQQFEKIPMSFEYRRNFIQREINALTEGINDLRSSYRSAAENRSSIKDMERQKKRVEARLKKLLDGKAKDTSLSFEQLGFDSLVVDEAHNYKNGLVVSKMNRVAGVQTTPAQKSEDILMKTQYLNETYGEKNIIFATGTPVSNSMTELYIMQRYLRPSLLENAGLQTFDDWANTFGEVTARLEIKPAGDGFRTKKRFAKFVNLPELMQMYKEFADIRTADMLKLPVPEIEGGKPQIVSAKPNEYQQAYMKILAERSELIHSGAVDPTKDNMLKITNEARLLGLDARTIDPTAENTPDSKINLLIDNVMQIYNETTAQKGVQAIFCDIAVGNISKSSTENSAEQQSDSTEERELGADEMSAELFESDFSAYRYIKEELIRRGIPENEICFAGDAKDQKQRGEMYAQLRSGTKRIVLASTAKMGTGANIQTKLCALHNLDITWKPSDFEQRIGRIVRQGNENKQVKIMNYVTEGTFDAYMLNLIVTKQKFIAQLMSGKTPARTCEDVDETVLNYSEMQAIASGDPRIKEKIELDNDVARLRLLESEYYNEQYRLDDTISKAKNQINNYKIGINEVKNDLEFAEKNRYEKDDFKAIIGGKIYTERKAAGVAIKEAAVKMLSQNKTQADIGSFCGFNVSIEKNHGITNSAVSISIRRSMSYSADIDITGDIGNAVRLENIFADGIEKKLNNFTQLLNRYQNDLQVAENTKGKPFEHAEELAEKSARLEQLNSELDETNRSETFIDSSEKEPQEIKKNSPKHSR